MELHLHLSVAFRALDRKWGSPVDLDSSADGVPCLPAVIEQPTATFSSEEYLRSVKRFGHSRPSPYSRGGNWKRKQNVKKCDSFSNISLSRFPSKSDLGRSVSTLDSSIEYDFGAEEVDRVEVVPSSSDCSSDEEVDSKDYGEYIGASTETLDSVLGKKKGNGHFLKHLKNTAVSFVENKRWKKLRL